MAITLSQLQDYVDANIKQNGRNAITGNVMNYALQNTLSLLIGKQDALVSGTTIKTINGVSLLGSGDITISGGGASVAGSDKQIQFNDGGAFGANSNLLFNKINGFVGIGLSGSTPTARLEIRAAGSAGSDYALKVRNSADTKDLLLIRGNGDHEFGATGTASLSLIASSGYSYPSIYFKGQGGTERTQIYMTSNTFYFICTTSDTLTLSLNTTAMTFRDGLNQVFGTTNGTKLGTSTSQKIGFWNATPIVQPTTAFASATLVSGGGTAITSTDTFDGYTLAQGFKILRSLGILA